MSVTNLTNTTWILNDTLDIYSFASSSKKFNINFTSNSTSYTSFSFYDYKNNMNCNWQNGQLTWGTHHYTIRYGYEGGNVHNLYGGNYGSFAWHITTTNLQTLSISGGTDVENTTLIGWLEANATQVQTTKNVKLKNDDGVVLYPRTTISQVTDLSSSLSGKQPTLVSGTNIKTINSQSLLGSGNIAIQSGVTSVTAGSGLTGGTITTSGTIAINTNVIQEKLTAGTGITISSNVVSTNMTYEEKVTVTGTATNCFVQGGGSYSGSMYSTDAIILNLTANGTTYKLPTSVTVTNATGTFTRTSDTVGTLVLTNATGNVTFSVVGEAIPQGVNVTFSTVTVGSKNYSTGGFVMTLDGRTPVYEYPSNFDYDLELEAEVTGNGIWKDRNGNTLTTPFTRTGISVLKIKGKGNGYTISLNGTQVVSVNAGDETIKTVNLNENCTLTGTAERTD